MTDETTSTEQSRVAADCPNERFVMRGARDMLREAAKQFRATGDTGHGKMCDIHADEIDRVLK